MECKIVINDSKTGKSYQKTLSEDQLEFFLGKKLGEEIDLSFLGLDGYTGKITGGSHATGIPMRKEIDSIGLKKILIEKGIGNKQGVRRRKSVAGNTISQFTSQINVSIAKYGEKEIGEILAKNNG